MTDTNMKTDERWIRVVLSKMGSIPADKLWGRGETNGRKETISARPQENGAFTGLSASAQGGLSESDKLSLEIPRERVHVAAMKTLPSLFSLAGFLCATALMAATDAPAPSSAIDISFEKPEEFTDFTMSYSQKDYQQESLMAEFREHLQRRIEPRLAPGQKLTIKFTDIDLAGDFEPWQTRTNNDIRIVKELYPPRVKLEFKLLNADGSVAAEGKRSLSNLSFMSSIAIPQSDSLRYDKELLSDWVRNEFPQTKK